jgi:hypothetical protein
MFKERKHTLNTIGKLSGIGFTLIGSYYFLSFLNGSTPRIKKTKKKKKKKLKNDVIMAGSTLQWAQPPDRYHKVP